MKFFNKCARILLWIIYILFFIVEWIVDLVERMWIAGHECISEGATGLKNSIDMLESKSNGGK